MELESVEKLTGKVGRVDPEYCATLSRTNQFAVPNRSVDRLIPGIEEEKLLLLTITSAVELAVVTIFKL